MSGLRRGFTLVEAISTIVIVAILGAVAAPVISTAISGYAATATRAELGSAASSALERIVTEMHDIPMTTGAVSVDPAIDSVTASSITWSTNSSLSLSGANLRLVIGGGTARTLLGNVSAFGVQAYDENNAPMAASLSGSGCDAIRRLQFTITATRGTGTSAISETMRTKVFLRCTMAGAEP